MLTVGVSPWFSHLLPLQPLRSVATWNTVLVAGVPVAAEAVNVAFPMPLTTSRLPKLATPPVVPWGVTALIAAVLVPGPGTSWIDTDVPSSTTFPKASRTRAFTPVDVGEVAHGSVVEGTQML